MIDPPVRSGSPSKQTKKWSQQSSEVISTYVQRHDAPDCAHNDGELPPFHIGQGRHFSFILHYSFLSLGSVHATLLLVFMVCQFLLQE